MTPGSAGVLCLVTDGRASRGPLPETVAAAVAAGVDWVQVRDKALEGEDLLALVRAIQSAVQRAAPGTPVLVNRRIDVAVAAGASGVHLGFDAVPADRARELLGTDRRIGASCHDAEEIVAAGADLDYAHLAPIFDPLSKPAERPALGVEVLAEACRRASLPVLAQGGITAENARACLEAGAAGVAVTGEILMADDPARATRALREALS